MYTALNISSRNIKVLTLSGRRVKTWANLDLASGLVRDGMILQPQVVGEAIHSLFKSTGIPKKNVIVSIAGLPFTYRVISLPRIKSALTEEAILRAAKKEISLPLEELYVAWQPIPGKGEEQEFFVLGVSRNPVDTLLQTLKIANIEPYLMELRPLALARAANRSDAIAVNMELDCCDIVLITNGIPAMIHTITPRSEGATLEDNIRRLADELRKIAAFNQSNKPDIQLSPSTPLLLTGELASEAIQSGLLKSEIEYPVELLIPPVEYPGKLPITLYTASIGLALKKTTIKPSGRGVFSDIDINILDGKYRKPKAKPLPMKNVLLTILLVAAIGILFPLYQARTGLITENQVLEDSLNSINREINLATLVNEETLKTEAEISGIIGATEALKAANIDILSTRGDFNTGLQKVAGIVPAKTYFTSIEIDKNTVTIKGEADSVFTVTNYATALEGQGLFAEVRIVQLDEAAVTLPVSGEAESTPVEVTVIVFEIICTK